MQTTGKSTLRFGRSNMGNQNLQEPKLSENLALVDRMGTIAERHACRLAEIAIAWTLQHPTVTGAIVGSRSPDQVDGFRQAADPTLSPLDNQSLRSQLN
jgi:aryl-alcohol dehydrogenase-like predicted oxidoreductase